MGRPKIKDLDLPRYVYRRRNSLYFVRHGVWISLGTDLQAALKQATAMRRAYDGERLNAARVRRAIMERDGYVCIYCGATGNLQLDHVIPVARGGAHSIANLVVSCKRCNVKKGTRHPLDFLREVLKSARIRAGKLQDKQSLTSAGA